MFVSVILLRSKGHKLPPDRLHAQKPITGRLIVQLDHERWGRKRDQPWTAMILDEKSECKVQLHRLQLAPVKDHNFMYRGVEEVFTRRATETYPQAWWFWPIMRPTVPEGVLDDDLPLD